MPRRARLALFLVLTIALGVASRRVHLGVSLWDKSAGDVLYTVAVVLVLGLALPRARAAAVVVAGLALSVAVELFQLTGIPLALARAHPWTALFLGTTFAWHDLACYVVGAALAALLVRPAQPACSIPSS